MDLNLRPVVYTTDNFKKGATKDAGQTFLATAREISRDPHKVKELISVKQVADIYKTLDKISMRKEYHSALSRRGISFDYLIQGLKNVADGAEKDGDRVKAIQILLKSVGMDKYDESSGATTGSWEDTLLKKIEEEGKESLNLPPTVEYAVIRPTMPASVVKAKQEEAEIMKTLYGNTTDQPNSTG